MSEVNAITPATLPFLLKIPELRFEIIEVPTKVEYMLQIEKTRINQVTVVRRVCQTLASNNSELSEITNESAG